MANNDMNISMKFTADVNNAKSNIEKLDHIIKDSSDIAQEASRKNAESFQKLFNAQSESWKRVHVESVWDDYKAEQEKLAKAQEVAAKSAQVHQKEVDKLRNGLDKLLASIDPATKGLGRLDELESKLHKSKKEGVIDGDTFDNYLGKINNQRTALSTVDSLNSGTEKLSLNTRTAKRDMVSFLRQLASGNLSAAGNSLFNIGNSTGRLPPLFSAATLSVGAFVAGLYGIYKFFNSIQAEQNRFNKALISTGNYAGATSSQLGDMSNRVGKINSNYSETSQIIANLVNKGNISVRSIENIATASAHLVALTGQSAEEATVSFDSLKNGVTQWALETTQQYNWLDLATYQRIAALEAQGETEEAIAVATGKFADVMEQRVNDMQNQLIGLEAAWVRFKKGVSDFGHDLKTDFKIALNMATLDEQIAKLQENKANNSKITPDGFAVPWTKFDDEELQRLIEQRKLQEDKTQADNKTNKINKEAINAQNELNELWKNNRSETEKQVDAVEELRKKYQAIWADENGRKDLEAKGVTSADGKSFTGGVYDKDVKDITDKGIKEYNKSIEKSLKLTTELSRVMYEINEGQYKNATQAEKDKAIALAEQIDAKNAEKKNKKADPTLSNDKTNLGLQQQLNQLLLGTKASDETVDQWYNNLLVQFKKSGNKEGIDLIDQLLPLKKAEANLNDITNKIQQAQSRQSTKEQSIQAQVTSGLITQVEAQSQLVELHKQTADELAQYLPILESMTTLPGQAGENAQKALATLQLQIAELHKTTDALTNAFKNGLQNGIQSSLDGLAKGTYNLSEALLNLAQSVVSAMAQIATKGLADMAMTGLNNLFSFSDDSSQSSNTGAEIKASLTEGAATLTTALDTSFANGAMMLSTAVAGQSQLGTTTPIQTSTVATLAPAVTIGTNTTDAASAQMGNSITSAASSGAATIGTAIVSSAASGSNVLSSALNAVFSTAISGIISAMAGNTAASGIAGAAAVAAATGGYIRGPGTSTSDSIPSLLSDGEYVVKAAAVKKYGVDYLHAINTGRLHRYASGGLVSNVSQPKAPNLSDSAASTDSITNQVAPVIQQTLVLDSGDMLRSGINSTAGSRSLMTWVRANKPTLKQELA